MLSDAVEQVLRVLKPVSPGIRTSFKFVDLAYEEIITRSWNQLQAENLLSSHDGLSAC